MYRLSNKCSTFNTYISSLQKPTLSAVFNTFCHIFILYGCCRTGSKCRFTVYLEEFREGVKIVEGLTVGIDGPSEPEIEFDHQENGDICVAYTPYAPGSYIIHLKFNGEEIKESPFKVKVVGDVNTHGQYTAPKKQIYTGTLLFSNKINFINAVSRFDVFLKKYFGCLIRMGCSQKEPSCSRKSGVRLAHIINYASVRQSGFCRSVFNKIGTSSSYFPFEIFFLTVTILSFF